MLDLDKGGLDGSIDKAGSVVVDTLDHELRGLIFGRFSIDEIVGTLTNALHNLDITKNAHPSLSDDGVDINDAVRSYKIGLIKCALRKCRGRQNQAAKFLRLKQTTLNTIIKRYGIDA